MWRARIVNALAVLAPLWFLAGLFVLVLGYVEAGLGLVLIAIVAFVVGARLEVLPLDPERLPPLRAPSPDWIADCLEWRGRVLTGRYAHWCGDYDDLPVDETCAEWPCACAPGLEREG